MHEIHHTEGFILKSHTLGEASKIYSIFTRDFGTIFATAQSVRLEKSKLKSHLEDYAHISVDLVKGRDFWRITNARVILSLPFSAGQKAKRTYVRTMKAVERLSLGEEKNEKLFEHLKDFTENITSVKESSISALDTLSIAKILDINGYFNSDNEASLLVKKDLMQSLPLVDQNVNKKIIELSNLALKQTQL